MQLYTVHMTTKSIVSRFDDKGRKIEEIVSEIPVTFHDLPLQTAHMYRDKNPDGNVRIVAQQGVLDNKRARASEYASRPREERRATKPAASKSTSPQSSVQNAAQTGDLSAALNQR